MQSGGNHAQPSAKPIEVAAAVVIREGRLLITQRYEKAHLGGLWEFPGGKLEPGESWEQCLARELMEELGIEVSVRQEIERLTHHYPEKTVHLRFFICHWLKHEPKTLGCPDFRWVLTSELNNFQFPAADSQLLSKLQRMELS